MTLDSATLLYTYISRFSVNPHYISRGRKSGKAAAINFIPQPLSISLFNFSHKWPTFAFADENGYTEKDRTQRLTRRNKWHFGWGWYHYPRSVPHVHKHPRPGCQNGKLCRFWVLVWCAPEERRKPAEQRCAYACRCPEGVAAPLGCVILSLLCQ